MKKLISIIALITSTVSCGKKEETKECRTREEMTIRCRVENQPQYGYQYAQELCDREYHRNACY
jgi:hypothetical protein